MAETGSTKGEAVTRGEVEEIVNRVVDRAIDHLDRRIEKRVGVAEGRLIGKMAETESRLRRHTDERFDEAITLMHKGIEDLREEFIAARA